MFERRSLSNPQEWLLKALSDGVDSNTGISVTDSNSLQVSAVFACVKLLAESVATMPFNVLSWDGNTTKKMYNHPVQRIIKEQPNAYTTAFDFWLMMMFNLLLTGNGFAYITRDGTGTPIELTNIPSGNVKIFKNLRTGETYYKVAKDSNSEVTIYPENMLVINGYRYSSESVVLNPIKLARESIGLALATEQFGAKYFINGTASTVVCEVPDAMDAEYFKDFKTRFHEQHAGLRNANKALILTDGAKVTSLSNTAEQAQFIETRRYQISEICRYFGVSPTMIQELDKSSYSTNEQQNTAFVQYGLSPWLVRIEESVNMQLFAPKEKKKLFTKFNVNSLLRGDMSARKDFYQSAINFGWMTPNEVREIEDMPPVHG